MLPIKWKINDEFFIDKRQALKTSSELGIRPIFILGEDELWESIVPYTTNLNNLYKQRAIILREKYKKIKLFFSGGSDSRNILFTFLKNNIPIDEIVVRWSSISLDGRFHYVNDISTDAKNSLFEWDYAIKPVLDYVSLNFPKIKITIEDFTTPKINQENNFTVDNIIDVLEKNKFMRGTLGSVLQRIGRENNFVFEYQTANIFGVEKPIMIYNGTDYFFTFNDLSFEMFTGHSSGIPEPFYWSVDFPQLPVTQAYALAKYYEKNPNLKNNLLSRLYESEGREKIQKQNKIARSVLYSYWDENIFQVDKPNFYRDDWWGWLEKVLPISQQKINENFTVAVNEFYSDCQNSIGLMRVNQSDKKPRPKLPAAIFSKMYKINLDFVKNW